MSLGLSQAAGIKEDILSWCYGVSVSEVATTSFLLMGCRK